MLKLTKVPSSGHAGEKIYEEKNIKVERDVARSKLLC
jgi:hypothetical protein